MTDESFNDIPKDEFMSKLIVIAGPSGVGKSHTIRLMRTGLLTAVSDKIGLARTEWVSLNMKRVSELSDFNLRCLVVECDTAWPWKDRHSHDFSSHKFLTQSHQIFKELAVVNLWATPEVLRQRRLLHMQQRRSKKSDSLKIARMDELLSSPSLYLSLYEGEL